MQQAAVRKSSLVQVGIENIFSSLLSVAGNAAFVVGSAMAAVAAGRVKFAFDFVQGDVVATMLKVTVRAVAVAGGGFHFHLVGVAVVAEGAFVAGGAEPVVRGGVEAVVLDE